MFTNNQNPISAIRRELRGYFPDSWLDEVMYMTEYTDGIDVLSMEDLLKLKVECLESASFYLR